MVPTLQACGAEQGGSITLHPQSGGREVTSRAQYFDKLLIYIKIIITAIITSPDLSETQLLTVRKNNELRILPKSNGNWAWPLLCEGPVQVLLEVGGHVFCQLLFMFTALMADFHVKSR